MNIDPVGIWIFMASIQYMSCKVLHRYIEAELHARIKQMSVDCS